MTTDDKPLNTSQDIDNAIRAEIAFHTRAQNIGVEITHCARCGDLWPCQYIIQSAICLKLTAIAGILSADQAAIIQSIVKGGGNGQKVERR